jgi:hypothetical protein
VVDGLWRSRRFVDFVRGVGDMRGEMRAVGPFHSPLPDGDVEGFIDDMRARMEETMAALRDGAA